MGTFHIPEVRLNSDHKMPLVGMGTGISPMPPQEELLATFVDAIDAGYRHFDTASLYGTEEALGLAIRKALERGIIKNRDELFITSKLWCTDAHHDLVLPALKETLRKLRLSYVDLYLIHWPVRIKHEVGYLNFAKEDVIPFDIKGTWKAMEECYTLGLVKSIGVSNFSRAKISRLLEDATIPPAVNQVEMNVAWQQHMMLEFCKERGIHVSAWSPLGANGGPWGSLRVIQSPILQEIAAAKGKSVAQVAIRWIHEQGASAIVRSLNKQRMRENLQIFSWSLTDEEAEKIKQIPQIRTVTGVHYVHENGPYKSIDELWDGEQ